MKTAKQYIVVWCNSLGVKSQNINIPNLFGTVISELMHFLVLEAQQSTKYIGKKYHEFGSQYSPWRC